MDVSAVVGTSVYRVKMPDNPTLPAITFQTLSGEVAESRDGDGGLSMPVIGVDCWARTAKAAQDLATLARAALLGYRGTYSDREIHNALEWSQYELYDADTEVFHVSCSLRVWYS